MSAQDEPLPILASDAPFRNRPSNYPEPFASMMKSRSKQPLGDVFGLRNFGVNLIRLAPGGISALHHRHTRQDEFTYVLEGTPTLHRGDKTHALGPGMIVGFPSAGLAHHLENRSNTDCVVLEVGDRSAGDSVEYPHDDLKAGTGPEGNWLFVHKDGTPYQ
ncbi:cupin domain-containing protein [Pseudomonas sp. GD03842]|uniref:cupin domain-containing protein n=1 Tax=Pseudomonas sp. GD03842 TaxID=2975385 RepID=UPI002449364D|nr:cupin domain-containing protein [Pseudomonas sp. GD03842]MDH0748807.1 cupin domain-containing protein [Pseudomonas sp. GD03842]